MPIRAVLIAGLGLVAGMALGGCAREESPRPAARRQASRIEKLDENQLAACRAGSVADCESYVAAFLSTAEASRLPSPRVEEAAADGIALGSTVLPEQYEQLRLLHGGVGRSDP
jgi:hypothetical protein